MFDLFTLSHPAKPSTALWMHTQHDLALVLLSLLVAYVGSAAAFYMAYTASSAASIKHRRVSLLCAGLVLGFGIWGMHFISMMAIHAPTHLSYNALKTSLAILPGVAAAIGALLWMQMQPPSLWRALGAGVLLGAGIAVVHYCGIAAMQFAGRIYLQSPLFWLALLCGLVFSIAACCTQYGLQQHHRSLMRSWGWALPALLLTCAMASLHYLSLYAMQLSLEQGASPTHWFAQHSSWSRSHKLALTITAMATVVFVILGLANALLRYRDLWQAVAVRDARLGAMVEASNDGVITIDVHGIVQDFNAAAQKIFGYRQEEVVGHNISMLMPSPLAEQHDGHLRKHLHKPEIPISLKGREVLGKHKNGHIFPLQLSIGKANTAAGTFFIGYVQDISERKRTDTQLRIAARVFQHVREGIAIIDAAHRISDVNPAFLQLMDKTREDCIGQPLEALYAEADIPLDISKLWQTVARQQYWQNEVMITRPNGTAWMLRLSISPVVNELKRPHHFIAVISDVSERPGLEALQPHTELHDPATGLPNRVLFMDRLDHCLLQAKRKASQVGVILVELQGPDLESDGRTALQLLGQLLEQQLRGTDTLARVADRQLALLLCSIKDAPSFEMLVMRMQQSLALHMRDYTAFGVQAIHMSHVCTPQPQDTAHGLMAQVLRTLQPLPHNPS